MLNPLNIELHKRNEAILKIRDIWILVIVISPHHKVRFFFHGIDEFFIVKDKVVRVEHIREESKALVRRLGKDFEELGFRTLNMKIRCNMACNSFMLGLSLY